MDFFRSRNFFSSVFALVVCLIGAAAFATYKQNEFKEAGNLLDHTHTAIFEVQDISSQILSLIALQRGYLLTQNEIFNQQYIGKQAEISQAFQFLPREDGPHRVVRMAQEQVPGAIRDGFLQGVEVEAPASVLEGKRGLDEVLAEVARGCEEGRIDGHGGKHVVTWLPVGPQGDVEGAYHAGQPNDPAGVDFPVVELLQSIHHDFD